MTLPPLVSPPSVTVVPGGGVNANCRASGVAKSIEVKPTSSGRVGQLGRVDLDPERDVRVGVDGDADLGDAGRRGPRVEDQLVGLPPGDDRGAGRGDLGGGVDRGERLACGLVRGLRQVGRRHRGCAVRRALRVEGVVRRALVLAGPHPDVGAVADDVGLAGTGHQGDPDLRRTIGPDAPGMRARQHRDEVRSPGRGERAAAGLCREPRDLGEPEVGGLDDGPRQAALRRRPDVDQQLGGACGAAGPSRRSRCGRRRGSPQRSGGRRRWGRPSGRGGGR